MRHILYVTLVGAWAAALSAAPATASAEAGEHAHKAPHGGEVATTSGGHLELAATREGQFQLWLLDGKLALRPVGDATGTIKVAAAGYTDVALGPAGDHLEDKGAAIPGEHATAIATVKVGGKVETARFILHLEGNHAH